MRNAVVPLALLLSFATGFVLAELRTVVLTPTGGDDDSAQVAENIAAVSRFYDAVNQTLATGEIAPFVPLLAAEFVEHTARPGVTPDGDGLIHFLRALHAAEPGCWLTVIDLFAQGDRVAALVRVDGASGKAVPGLPAVEGRAWGTVDVFRLQAGRIVEHWGDNAGLALIEPLLAVSVPVEPPAMKWVEVGRREYPPGSTDQRWAGGPAILIIESDTLTVEHDRLSTDVATVFRAAAARVALPAGETATLEAGDALVLGRGSLYRTRNDGDLRAIAFTISVGDPPTPSPSGAAAGGQGASTPATTYDVFVGGFAVLSADWATVTIGRAALAPGAALKRHRVENVELVVVEAGNLALAVAEGNARIQDPQVGADRVDDAAMLGVDAGVNPDAGATVAYRNAGEESLVLAVVTITEGAGAAAPVD